MFYLKEPDSEGLITGFTSNYIRVEYPWESKLAGQIRKVKLNEYITIRKNEC